METNKASFGTELSCFFPEGASPASMKLRTSTPSTTKKPRTFTPFNIIDILKPEKYSQDESVGSDDSDSDALRNDLDHTAENENTRQQTDYNIKSPDDDISRSLAQDNSGSADISRSLAQDNSGSADISRSLAQDNSGSADISRSSVTSHQVTTADTRLGYYLNQDPHHGPTVPENATPQGISQSSSSSANRVYAMYPYPMFKPAMFPSVYPTVTPYLPPARSQPLGGHPNSCQDVATHSSPNCSGRDSPSDSSSDESRNPLRPTLLCYPQTPQQRRGLGPRVAEPATQRNRCAPLNTFSLRTSIWIMTSLSTCPPRLVSPTRESRFGSRTNELAVQKEVLTRFPPCSPHMAATMTSSLGMNNMVVQFPVLTPTTVSLFPGFPSPTMLPRAVY